ncbi:MAG TPA: TonB-dependent receptor [Thermoanaerobaculia bacterium]|nr:TonB-dependent receptor [Thermoanaerobaculia bacterium]
MRTRHASWFFLALLLLLPLVVWGQAEVTGKITGKVTDDQGHPIAGATVEVTSTGLKIERQATTGENGEFLFAILPTGAYTVAVSAVGHQPEVINLRLGIGQTVPLDVSLNPGEAIKEEITVTGTASALETTTTGERLSYSRDIEQLPVLQRNLEDVAQLAPNVSFGPTAGTLSIAGAPSFDTTVLLDGAEVSDPYFGSAPVVYLEDAIDEIQVLATGVGARYGRFQGGVINAVTKSGTNEFKGTLRTELSNQKWNSATPFGEDREDKINKVYQGTLGGPIVRDHLWFFGGGRKIPSQVTTLTTTTTDQSYSQGLDERRWQGKLRWAISPSHLIDASYLSFDSSITNDNGLPAGDDLALGKRADPRETYTMAYQGVLSGTTFVEVQATKKNVAIQGGSVNATRDPILDLASFSVFNNHWWDFNDPSIRDNKTAAVTLSNLRDLGRFGSHDLEGGIQYVSSTTGGENRQSASGFNILGLNSDFVVRPVANPDDPRFNLLTGNALRWEALHLNGDQTLKNTAAYVQDQWNLPRWRFDVGVRYEKYKGDGPLPQFRLSFNDFSPRLGATFSVTPNLQLQATYGKYVSRFNDAVANAITGVGNGPLIQTLYLGPDLFNLTRDQVQAAIHNNAYWPLILSYSDPNQPTSFLANNIKAPYANEITTSVRGNLPAHLGTAVLTYIHRDYKQLIDNFVGDICDYGINFGKPCPSSNTTTVFQNGAPVAEVDSIMWANNPQAHRTYNALTGSWNIRPPNKPWSLGGNYTYSKTRGNYEGEGQNTPSSGSPLGDYIKAVNPAAIAPDGFTNDDIRNRANVFGTYRLGLQRFGDLTFGSVFLYQSGLPFSLTAQVPYGSVPTYLGASGTYTYFFGERGSHRFDDIWALDVSTRYDLPLHSRLAVFLKGGVTNISNNHAVASFQTTGDAVFDANGNPIAWQPSGNCGLGDKPSKDCTGFGRIRNDQDYQRPRTFLFSVGLDF